MILRVSFVALFALLGLASPVDAQPGKETVGSLPIVEANPQVPVDLRGMSQAESAQIIETRKDAWRYKLHNGHWWYWMPGKYWVYRANDRWALYAKSIYRAPHRSPPPTARVYRSNGNQRRAARFNSNRNRGGAFRFRDMDHSDAMRHAEDFWSVFLW